MGRHEPPSTPLPTGEWGRPPRPEPRDAAPPATRFRRQWRQSFASPPPPPPALERSGASAPLSRRRLRTAGAELAIAAAVIGSVALATGGSPSPHRANAQSRWNSKALPALTRLIGDLASVGSDASGPSPSASRIYEDAANLQADLSAARANGPPPVLSARRSWESALGELGSVVAGADAAAAVGAAGAAGAGARYESQLSSLRSEVAAAGDALLHLAADLRAGS